MNDPTGSTSVVAALADLVWLRLKVEADDVRLVFADVAPPGAPTLSELLQLIEGRVAWCAEDAA